MFTLSAPFLKWVLPQRLTLQSLPSDTFATRWEHAQASSPTLHVVLESEDLSSDALAQVAKGALGHLPTGRLLAASTDASRFVLVIPKSGPKKLSNLPPGSSHQAAWTAGLVAAALCAPDVLLSRVPQVALSLSGAVLAPFAGAMDAFVAALLQRSALLKVTGKDSFSAGTPNSDKPPYRRLEVLMNQVQCDAEHLQKGRILHEGMTLTRSLVNTPANILQPSSYETLVREYVREECTRQGNPSHILVDVYNDRKLRNDGCGLITAVGQGSPHLPRIIRLSHTPRTGGAGLKHVVLVGKGITYDTGGNDIKPPASMRNMKKDMGGSAAALGIFHTVVRLGLPLRVTCYLALAENMVDGLSFRPGDIFTAKNGLTVEIDNTDAEGRLALADALCYAQEDNPDWIIDLATLTGACRVALGPQVDGHFSTHPELQDIIQAAALETGDWVWNLPFVDDYDGYYTSNVADMTNSGGAYAGAIVAAGFLKKFVGKFPWTHIDTFMWADKAGDVFGEAGATGKCVRLVTAALENWSKC